MNKLFGFLLCCVILAGCSSESPKPAATEAEKNPAAASSGKVPEWKSGFRVFVTNETSGDLSIIDGATLEVIGTVPLGKRPRGIHASPDGKTIYVALSGSPMAPPGVDESTAPGAAGAPVPPAGRPRSGAGCARSPRGAGSGRRAGWPRQGCSRSVE